MSKPVLRAFWAEHPSIGPTAPLAFKVGGKPDLLAPLEPQRCAECGELMALVAQVPLREPLRLSSRWDMAYAFMCAGSCDTGTAGTGANAVIFQSGRGRLPVKLEAPEFPEVTFRLEPHDEPVVDTSSRELSDEDFDAVSGRMKLGGVPAWMGYADTPACPACEGEARLIAQIDSTIDWPPEGRNLAQEAKIAVTGREVERLLEREKHVLIHVEPFGVRIEARTPASEAERGTVTIVDAMRLIERSGRRSEMVLPFGDAGRAFIFGCADECGERSGAFLWQSC